MIKLREVDVQADARRLAAAWAAPETFVLLPDRLGGAESWLERGLCAVPASLKRDHFVMLTSGSTGLPKLVVGRRDRAERLVRVLHDVQESDAVATTVGLLPLSYTYAFVNQWLWAHVMNRVYVPTAGLTNPAELYRILEGASAVMLCLVGVQVPLLLAHFADAIFPGVIRVHFAGGRFPQERLPEVRVLFPNASVYNNYGCAEALPRLTVRKATAPAEAANVGRPLPGVELRVNDPDAIHFRSPYAAVGVVEGEAFIPIGAEDWVPSGDLGFLNADGSWTLLGRPGEVFKRHGEKVSLLALTTTVTSAWSGQHAFYRERDPSGEEGCVLAIAPMATAIEIRSVLSALRRNHPRSHWPLRIESLPVLPMLDNGKVDIRSIITVGSKCVLWKQHI